MTPFDIEGVRREFPGRAIDYFSSVDSTMRAAAGRAAGYVVVAGEQTAGQGRHGHSWHSEAGAGLYFSIVLEPSPVLTLAIGLAAQEAIAQVTGVACDLRWPNDLMLDNKKLAGILVQLAGRRAIAGIGINLNQTTFPPDLEATSLKLHTGRDTAAEDLLIALLKSIAAFTSEDKETILRLFTHT